MIACSCDRRRFCQALLPLGVTACLGLRVRGLLAETVQEGTQEAPEHKFDQPMPRPLTYRERFELAYASHFIPFLNILEEQIGREDVIESLKQLALQEAEEYARYVVREMGNDISVFKRLYHPSVPQANSIMTIEVTEDSESAYGIKISECLWAEVFQAAGAADLGYYAVCYGDVPFAGFVNPDIDLELSRTIMEGNSCCNLRYYYKS